MKVPSTTASLHESAGQHCRQGETSRRRKTFSTIADSLPGETVVPPFTPLSSLKIVHPIRELPSSKLLIRASSIRLKRRRARKTRSVMDSARLESESEMFSSSRPPQSFVKQVKRGTPPVTRLSFSSRRMSFDFAVFTAEAQKLEFSRVGLQRRLVQHDRRQDDDCDTDEEQVRIATQQIKKDLKDGFDALTKARSRRRRAVSLCYRRPQ